MESSDNVIFVFFMYSVAMFVLPLFTFFSVKNILAKDFDVTGFANTAWSVIGAVIMANIIIVLYVRRAYKQEIEEEDKPLDIPHSPKMSSVEDHTMHAKTKNDLNWKKDQ